MKRIYLPDCLAAWLMFTSISFGQMSTFPSPPPLAPPSDSASDAATNTPSTPPAPSDFSISNPGDNGAPGGSTSSPAGETAESSGNAIPISAGSLTSMEALDDKISLQPGDHISFRVIEDKDQAVPRIVTDTGEVDFPYIGRVKVQGQTCHQVALELKKLLEVDYYKRATVIIGLDTIADDGKDKEKPRDIAWVVGQVRQVGPQELSKVQPMTVSQIILRAGGFGDFADQRKVKIIHRASLLPPDTAPDATGIAKTATTNATNANPEIPEEIKNSKDMEIVDVKAVFDGKSTFDPVVKPNDYIIVPKRLFNY